MNIRDMFAQVEAKCLKGEGNDEGGGAELEGLRMLMV